MWRWRPGVLIGEALRNLGVRQVGVGLLLALVLSAVGVLSATQAGLARDQEVAGQLSGSLVWQVSAMPENPLSGNDCERLNWLRGVAAAGGIALVEPELALALNPPIPLPAKQITPHALRVWGSEAPTGGQIVGTDLEALGFASVG